MTPGNFASAGAQEYSTHPLLDGPERILTS